jgi:tetratricopeptide (TPR) repeat protein
MSAAEALHRARQLHQAGDLARAELLYRQALEADPANVEAWRLLGAACQGQGKRADDAACYRRALRLEPRHAEALTDLGVALAEQGQLDEAAAALRQACLVQPAFAKAHYNLAVALAQLGKLDDAEAAFREALRLQSGYAAAHYGLGNVLRDKGRRDEAIACYREALRLKPDYGEAYNNLGLSLTEAGALDEAVIVLRQAVRLRPGDAGAHTNLGLALAEQGRWAEAEASYHEALRLRPQDADAHTDLGNCYKEQGRTAEALACYQLALWHQPELAPAHFNRALAWLQAGDYERGWAEYEWRWRRPQTPPRPLPRPAWDGSPLGGRTLLVHMEQGVGDMIQFLRYAPLVQRQGSTVLVECPASLVQLFSTCRGIDWLVAEGTPLPPFDVHAPLLSLPRLLGTTLATVPAAVPYLAAEPARVERWQRKLAPLGGFKVGITWQGNPKYQWDRYRSLPLACFAPLAAVPGVRLVSLQKGPGAEQLRPPGPGFAVAELPGDWDGGDGAFLDTAAVMQCLDLVVTADTAAAHLAGALAVPVWVALAAVADWRWVLGRDDSPWYPGLRLFRQARLGDWAPVFARLADELRRLSGAAGRSGRVLAELSPGELIDKLTILGIKAERIADPDRLAHVHRELEALERARAEAVPRSEELARLTAALRAVNEALWDVEDEIRLCEQAQHFGPRFVELARSVYHRNDERSALKRRINELAGARFSEQKAYPAYG